MINGPFCAFNSPNLPRWRKRAETLPRAGINSFEQLFPFTWGLWPVSTLFGTEITDVSHRKGQKDSSGQSST